MLSTEFPLYGRYMPTHFVDNDHPCLAKHDGKRPLAAGRSDNHWWLFVWWGQTTRKLPNIRNNISTVVDHVGPTVIVMEDVRSGVVVVEGIRDQIRAIMS